MTSRGKHHYNPKPTDREDTSLMPDIGVSLMQIRAYLHLDGDAPGEEGGGIEDADLWVLALDCWRSLKGTLHSDQVPPRLLLQVIGIRYFQPRAHRRDLVRRSVSSPETPLPPVRSEDEEEVSGDDGC